jgi:AcrR family transcriptional regulator
MGRWEPNAALRLWDSALELFEQRGFEQTTVAEIAASAGLTERTFFRYFADKREVLFRGSAQLTEVLVSAVDQAPASASALEAVTAGLEAVGGVFEREFASRRRAVILANPELQERELIKLASLTQALDAALRKRGISDSTAALAAQTGIAVFHVTFERWVTDLNQEPWTEHLHAALGELTGLVAAS